MKKFKTIAGLCAMLVVALCAFGAQGAAAETAFTCEPATGANVQFKDAHCKDSSTPLPASGWRHTELPEGVVTPILLTNETTGGARSTGKLKSVQSGVTLELQAAEVEGTGSMENKKEGATMWAQGTGTITFKKVTVTAPKEKGCEVVGGQVTTVELAGTTKGLTKELKFAPAKGEEFATFTVAGCSVTALNHAYTASGSVKGSVEGTTTNFTHTATTAQNTLSLFGQNAGLEGQVTIRMKEPNGTAGNGIGLT